ncbi:hypothetical protein BFS06_08510 [Clostridium perfringens]|uniref:SH3 domain-containing protein n=1 Tax=Clostridium perfringens TaxID=1502 RepID=UPI00103D9B1A|nr:SH3 domain-containing protein [Clostridium perfringens]TBX18236.1 hypothetical protein BFS06_08510 [Clostridium perfringens]
MKNKLTKKFAAFAGAVMVAGTLMILGNNTEAYASCIDQNTVKPSNDLYEVPAFIRANGGLNIRRGPGTNYQKIGWVGQGEYVKMLQVQGKWIYIKYSTPNGCKVGWGYGDYIQSLVD